MLKHYLIVSQYKGKYNRLKNNACNTLKKKNAGYREETEFVSRSLARLRHWNHKHIEKEKSIVSSSLAYISATIRSSEPVPVHFSPYFLGLVMKY